MTFTTLHIGHSRHGLFFTRWIVNPMLNLLKGPWLPQDSNPGPLDEQSALLTTTPYRSSYKGHIVTSPFLKPVLYLFIIQYQISKIYKITKFRNSKGFKVLRYKITTSKFPIYITVMKFENNYQVKRVKSTFIHKITNIFTVLIKFL
jgi:hypothetical protein